MYTRSSFLRPSLVILLSSSYSVDHPMCSINQSILFNLQYFQCTVLSMVDRQQRRAACRVAVLSLLCSLAAAQVNNAAGLGNVNQNLNPNPDAGVVFTGSGTNLLYGGERDGGMVYKWDESMRTNFKISYHISSFQ